jgi:hypothetical protein
MTVYNSYTLIDIAVHYYSIRVIFLCNRRFFMKKLCAILLTISIVLLSAGLIIRYWQYQPTAISAADPIAQIMKENADRIAQVIALCEGDEGTLSFGRKAYTIIAEHDSWLLRNKDILSQNPNLLSKADEAWMEALYTLSLSLKDSNDSATAKKEAVIQYIKSRLQNDVVEEYIKKRMK